MKYCITLAVVALLMISLSGCKSFLTEEQRLTAVASVESAYSRGEITKAERDIAVEKLNQDGVEWEPYAANLLNLLLALTGAKYMINRANTQQVAQVPTRRSPIVSTDE